MRTTLFMIFTVLMLTSCNPAPHHDAGQDGPQDTVVTSKSNPAVTETALTFDTYCNARFGYCVDYPKELIYPQPESENGDGRVFKNRRGEEILTVFGRNNINPTGEGDISLEQQYNEDLHGATEENGNAGRVITYQKLGKAFFVISGLKDGKIFYQKTILKDGAFAYAILRYDEAEGTTFDKISDRIFQSFK